MATGWKTSKDGRAISEDTKPKKQVFFFFLQIFFLFSKEYKIHILIFFFFSDILIFHQIKEDGYWLENIQRWEGNLGGYETIKIGPLPLLISFYQIYSTRT